MKQFECAQCGGTIPAGAYMFRNNFLIVKYFDDYKSNRFCSTSCACEALMCDWVESDELPLDDDEKDEEQETDDNSEDEPKECYNNCNGWCMVSPCGGRCPYDDDEQTDCESYEEG